jgi:hypothetical protein
LLSPAAVLAALGVGVLAVSGCGGAKLARGWRVGAGVVALSAFSALYLVAIPKLFEQIAKNTITLAALGSLIGTSAALTVVGAVWKLVGGPLVHEVTYWLSRLLPRLLGVLMVAGWLASALVVMFFAAHGDLPAWTLLLPIGALALIFVLCSPNWPTLHTIFSCRLQRSFDPTAFPFGSSSGKPMRWTELAERSAPKHGAPVPELILCCAQQRNGIAAGGLQAESFTVSPNWIRQGRRSMATTDYLDAAADVKRLFKRSEYADLERPAAWLATTGAAFSSAMGRTNLGSTNALLAAINADLGVWLPNLRWLHETKRMNGRPLYPPRFGYVLKEILGIYNSQSDHYVFITDGGHWDNLGLVELLRRRCNEIYCVDASGDPPGSFATLRQTLCLASLELNLDLGGTDLDKCLEELLPKRDGPAATNVTSFTLHPKADPTANGAPGPVTIHYAKLQATEDMGHKLRRYAIADPKFPTYSTLKQFLSPLQFAHLVAVGRHAGRKLADRALVTVQV